jgi:GNAT superfamily N-acetyltransferase
MAKSLTEIRSLARSRTKSALDVLIAVMRNTKSPPAARIAAANAILDRGWGKPPQAIQNGDDGALELIHRIERVIGEDDDTVDTLSELHRLTFFESAPVPKFDHGHWWLVLHETGPVAFAGIIPSTHVCNAGYFCRVGVLREHSGQALQLRLMRALEARARLNGWCSIVSDTTDNISSANNFIRAGYRLFRPEVPWAWPNTLYWRKLLG